MALLPPLASVADLEARLGFGTLTGNNLSRAEAALDDASSLIRSLAGMDWIDDMEALDFGELAARDIDSLESTCLAVAARAYRNPEGARQASVGDTSVSYGAAPGGSVYLTPAEMKVIRHIGGLPSIGTVELVSPNAGVGSTWYVPVAGGGDPLPFGPLPWEM